MTDQRTPGQAPAPTTAETAAAARRRGRALAGALAGVVVFALLVVVFFVVRSGGSETTPAAQTSAPAAPPADAPPPVEAQPSEPPAAQQPQLDPKLQEKPEVTAGEGELAELKVTALVRGTGEPVQAGQQILVNYVGVTYADGKQFDSSWDRGQPFPTAIGVGQVIPGWDQGLVGAPVGSRVQLDIPAELAYGENPTGGQPAGALRFVVDILQAQ